MKKWKVGTPDRKIISQLMLKCGVTSLTAASLAFKGYTNPETVMEKLNTDELSDPFDIKDMREAADVINEAINNDEKICVYGDYDCDGIMATVILYTYLFEAGANVMYYIPERSEGYGLNKEAIREIHDDGIQLIITVDNGISAVSEAEYIYELGMRLVVTDHHQQGEQLPRAEAVVDPHRHDCFSSYKFMCGAGIALKLVTALNDGDYTMALEQFGDLAAIATIADIVSLTGENRFLAAYGLELIRNSDRPAIMALKEISGIDDSRLDTHSIGFGIAPRINASGRFGSPASAVELFLTEDYEECLAAARELDSLNMQRKNVENTIISEIYDMLEADTMFLHGRVIFLCGKDWHHGVIGIVASRISEQFGKPCFIASETEGEIRGSARSFGDFSVFKALTYASDMLEKFGGHQGAGGFTIKQGMADTFRDSLEKYAYENHRIMPEAVITADYAVQSAELAVDNVKGLSLLEPFGMDNEKPLFYIDNAKIIEITPLSGGIHSKLRISFGASQFDALLFRTAPHAIPVQKNSWCDMIVSLGINEFHNRESVSIIVSELRPHGFQQSKYFAAFNAFEAFLRDEELPEKYYPVMFPSRDDVVKIYKGIPDDGINLDTLYIRLSDPQINYCRFRTSVEALRQLGLIKYSVSDSNISKVRVTNKTDLNSAPILVSLKEKIGSSSTQ